MNKKLTPWFPSDVRPVRPGIYETDADVVTGPCYQLWTGQWWGFCSSWPDYALEFKSDFQSPRWRGLASKP